MLWAWWSVLIADFMKWMHFVVYATQFLCESLKYLRCFLTETLPWKESTKSTQCSAPPAQKCRTHIERTLSVNLDSLPESHWQSTDTQRTLQQGRIRKQTHRHNNNAADVHPKHYRCASECPLQRKRTQKVQNPVQKLVLDGFWTESGSVKRRLQSWGEGKEKQSVHYRKAGRNSFVFCSTCVVKEARCACVAERMRQRMKPERQRQGRSRAGRAGRGGSRWKSGIQGGPPALAVSRYCYFINQPTRCPVPNLVPLLPVVEYGAATVWKRDLLHLFVD